MKQIRNLVFEFLENDFREVEFLHCNRIASKLADRLAKKAYLCNAPIIDLNNFLEFLLKERRYSRRDIQHIMAGMNTNESGHRLIRDLSHQ